MPPLAQSILATTAIGGSKVQREKSLNLVTPIPPQVWTASVPFQLNRTSTFLLDFRLQTDVQTSQPSLSKKTRYKLLWIGQEAVSENSRAGEITCEP